MTRRRWIQTKDGFKEVGVDYVPTPRQQSHYIIGDYQPYRCAGLGQVVKSRRHRRELMKEKNLVEVGNEFNEAMRTNDGRYDDVKTEAPSKELLEQVGRGL